MTTRERAGRVTLQTVALLRQLVDLTAQQAAETAAAKAARDAAYAAELEASRKAAGEKAARDAAAAAATAAAATATASASSAMTLDQYVRSRGYYLSTDDDGNVAAVSLEDGMLGPGIRREVAQSLIDDYHRAFPGYAAGGIARGMSIVGERGVELVDFTSPARIYTAEQTRGMSAPRDDSALIEEVRGFRTENAQIGQQLASIARDSRDTSTTLKASVYGQQPLKVTVEA